MTDDGNTITEPMDFRRIMAAWNACEGISTEALEAGIVNDMLEALREVVSEYDNPDNGRYLRWAVDEARAAIAKATGNTK